MATSVHAGGIRKERRRDTSRTGAPAKRKPLLGEPTRLYPVRCSSSMWVIRCNVAAPARRMLGGSPAPRLAVHNLAAWDCAGAARCFPQPNGPGGIQEVARYIPRWQTRSPAARPGAWFFALILGSGSAPFPEGLSGRQG